MMNNEKFLTFLRQYRIYTHMAKRFTITDMDRLQMAKKVSRETNIMPKPMITTDKKKEADKQACRKKNTFDHFERG